MSVYVAELWLNPWICINLLDESESAHLWDRPIMAGPWSLITGWVYIAPLRLETMSVVSDTRQQMCATTAVRRIPTRSNWFWWFEVLIHCSVRCLSLNEYVSVFKTCSIAAELIWCVRDLHRLECGTSESMWWLSSVKWCHGNQIPKGHLGPL